MNENWDIEKLVVKFLSGEASGDDIILISAWLKESSENEMLFRNICGYWNAKVSLTTDIDYVKPFDNLISRIRKEDDKPKLKKMRLKFSYAAAAVLLIGLFFVWNLFYPKRTVDTYTYLSGKSTSELRLPDGSKVSLNKNSVLKYTSSFGGELRKVSLEGEAFFEVTKDAAKPFVVDLNGTKITVLGTSFNVRNRLAESNVSATLITGKIRFDAEDQSAILKPDHQLVFNKNNKKISIDRSDVSSVIAWKNNLIKYDSLPFFEAIKLLEEQYAVHIDIADGTLRNARVTGTFDMGLKLEQILDMMKNNIVFNWKRTDANNYTITK